MYDFYIRSRKDLEDAVKTLGFLPYFKNGISGFSIEEHIAPELWFGSEEGAWEWKGPVIRSLGCGYGKLFGKKAAFVMPEWYCHLANYRRDGYDFDARYDDGLAKHSDKVLFELLDSNAPIISKRLKKLGDYRKGGVKGFDTAVTRLQEQCYVLISDFTYMTDKNGRQYGWGVAEYSTPEKFFGDSFTENVYSCEPHESFEILAQHLGELFPGLDEKALKAFLK